MRLCDDGCRSFGDGHRVHHIRARRAGESPWGWRDGLVTSVDGGRVVVRYLEGDAEVVLEHHREVPVSPDDPVRVHEEFRLLGMGAAWLGVAVEGALGAVPAPPSPGLWAAESISGIVDLASGDANAG